MKAEASDPRQTGFEVGEPAYHVHFWSQPTAPAAARQEEVMWHCEEWRLSEAGDVEEVLAWAEANAGGRHVVVWAEVRCGDELGLVRLLGRDPGAR